MDGYGMADLEQAIPISPQSVFYTASVSKQVVAMSAMLLDHEDRIDLDENVGAYLPSLPDYADQITVRQLLHHTSGIRDYFVLLRLAGRFDDVSITEDMIMEILAQQRGLNFKPGTRYAYSNSAYFLISQIVNEVEGRNLDAYSQEKIFGPLGMKNSRFQHDHRDFIKGKAHGYKPNLDGSFHVADAMLDVVGSGGMYSSVYDLILWDRNFYDNQLGGGQGLVDEMQAAGVLNSGDRTDYGLGLKLKPYRGLKQISHSGSLEGYRARLQRFPEQKFTVALLCNSSEINPTKLANQITDIYLSGEFAEKIAPTKAGRVKLYEIDSLFSPAGLASYAGRYHSDEVGNTIEIKVSGTGLRMIGMDGLQDNFLGKTGEDTFRHSKKRFELVFELGEEEAAQTFTFNAPRVSGVKFARVD